MSFKILLSCSVLILFTIDVARIIKRDPIRQEWVSVLYFIFFFIIFSQAFGSTSFLSIKNLIAFLSACGLTLVHGAVTVLNYWIVCIRWERILAFFIITWTGITGIFIFNLYLIWIF